MEEDTITLFERADRPARLADLLAAPKRSRVQDRDGSVIYEGWAAVEGVQPYASGAEYVTREALASQVADLIGKPVVFPRNRGPDGQLLHPGQGPQSEAGSPVTAENALSEGTVGTVIDAEIRDLPDGRAGQWVRVAVHDATAQKAIEGKAGAERSASGLSSAYSVQLDLTPGEFRGAPYMARQVARRGTHHLLLTDSPRGGSDVGLRADAEEGTVPKIADLDVEQFKALMSDAFKPVMDALADMKPKADMAPSDEEMNAKADAAVQAATADLTAKIEAEAARADVAEQRVAEFEAAQRRADAAPIKATLARLGLTVEGFDADAPTAEGIAAAQKAIADSVVRADATSTRTGPAVKPPKGPDSDSSAAPTTYVLPC